MVLNVPFLLLFRTNIAGWNWWQWRWRLKVGDDLLMLMWILICLQLPSPTSMWAGKFFPFKICGRPIYHFGVDRFVWPSTSYFFYSEITAQEGTHLFFGIFGYGDSAGVRLSEIICESNFRRHQWNYELSDELFSWIDFPFVLSAENEYEGAISNGGTIPWHLFFLTAPIWFHAISNKSFPWDI